MLRDKDRLEDCLHIIELTIAMLRRMMIIKAERVEIDKLLRILEKFSYEQECIDN